MGFEWRSRLMLARARRRHIFQKETLTAYDILVRGDSPVSYWPTAETAGTAAQDRGDSNPGVYTGGFTLAQAGPTQIGSQAVALNGTTGYVTVADAANLRIVGDLTLEAWINVPDHSNYYMLITKTAAGTAKPYAWFLTTSTGVPQMYLGDGSTQNVVPATAAPSTGAWHHLAVTVIGTTIQHYLDGATNGSGSLPVQARGGSASEVFYIGRRTDGFYFKGSVAKPAIYAAGLSGARISAHYSAGH
jgi:hypothetical protein